MSEILRMVSDLSMRVARLEASEYGPYSSGTWTPTFTGFSADPTSVVAQYFLIGKLLHYFIYMPNNGTSNANTFTLSLPFTAATLAGVTWTAFGGLVTNNGVNSTTPGFCSIASAATVMNLFIDDTGAAWATANAKGMRHAIGIYPIA